MLGGDLVGLPGGPPRALLEDDGFPVLEHLGLSLVDALQPVSEAAARAGEDGPGPERGAVEERAHLEAELPEADGHACDVLVSCSQSCPSISLSISETRRRPDFEKTQGGRYRTKARPEQYSRDHRDGWSGDVCSLLYVSRGGRACSCVVVGSFRLEEVVICGLTFGGLSIG